MSMRSFRLPKALSGWVALGCLALSTGAPAWSADSATALRQAREYRAAHERAILREFMQLLAIPNVASDKPDIARNAQAIEAMMQRRGLSPQLLRSPATPDAPPLVYGEWNVPGARHTIVLYAHYDGQPVNPAEWLTPPWTPTLRNARADQGGSTISADSSEATEPQVRLYARAAGDDKLGVMAILGAIDALHAIHRHPTDNLKVVFEGEEEAGSPHLQQILTAHRDLFRAQLWVVCDGPAHPSGRIELIYGVQGDVNADLTVYGANHPLHSGHYGNWAPNPALRLARLLASMKDDEGHVTIPGWYDGIAPLTRMERHAFQAAAVYDASVLRELGLARPESDWSLPVAATMPTLNINGMQSANVGAQAANVIPSTATAVLDMRLVYGEDPHRQFEKLRAYVQARGYYVLDREPTPTERLAHPLIATLKMRPGVYSAMRMPMSNPLARAIAAAVGPAASKPTLELPMAGGSLPLSVINEALGTPAMVVSLANADDNQHAANENLRLGNLWDGIDVFCALLMHGG